MREGPGAPPPFDPEVALALRTTGDVVTSLRPEGIAELRRRSVPPSEHEIILGGSLVLTRHVVPTGDDPGIALLLLRPREQDARMPVLYHVHGGGLVIGSAADDLPALAGTARDLGLAVASIEYRLAPEFPYPVPVEDVYRGLLWLTDRADALGLDPDRVIIGGTSAGGGLAAATALLARDRGGPSLLGQLLVCPMLDDRNDSHSARQMAGVGAWDRVANETGWSAYLGADRDDVAIYASPARASDLSGLPPVFLDVGSAETFRDEVVAYATQFWTCGGDAELHVWPGGAHGFDVLAPDAEISRGARGARSDWLRRLLARSHAGALD